MTAPTPASLEPELVNYRRQFEEAKVTASRLVDGLAPAQLAWKYSPDRWSIGECLAHLNTTAELYLGALDRAMATGRARGLTGRGPFRHGWVVNFFFIRALEPPVRMKLKAPPKFQPVIGPDASGQIQQFLDLQDELLERVQEANGLHLAQVRVVSPVARFLRMSLGQAFQAVAAHQRRHLLQARRVRDEKEFPDPAYLTDGS
jgi:hypothetical protein